MPSANRLESERAVAGILHVFVAFDWGDEIDLEQARRLGPSVQHDLPRKPRTPTSISYQPPPLRSRLDSIPLALPELGTVAADADITLFDFGAVSAAIHVPFQTGPPQLRQLAAWLADSAGLIATLRAAVEPFFDRIRPAIQNPSWSEFSEEYIVFEMSPRSFETSIADLLEIEGAWLAGLVRLEAATLSEGEIAEALRLRLSYTPQDLFLADWAAAVLIDEDCDEVLDTIALANVQLLEFRHIDGRLDARLQSTYGLIQKLARTWLPFWRSHGRTMRALGELKMEANVMLERTGDALKLVGDPYLARVYRMLAARFHLDEWSVNIRRALAVLEGTYQVISDQAAAYRMEALEVAIVVLILFEIVMALLGR